jgi:hypothetical protein
LNDYSFFSAPQLKRDPLGTPRAFVLNYQKLWAEARAEARRLGANLDEIFNAVVSASPPDISAGRPGFTIIIPMDPARLVELLRALPERAGVEGAADAIITELNKHGRGGAC